MMTQTAPRIGEHEKAGRPGGAPPAPSGQADRSAEHVNGVDVRPVGEPFPAGLHEYRDIRLRVRRIRPVVDVPGERCRGCSGGPEDLEGPVMSRPPPGRRQRSVDDITGDRVHELPAVRPVTRDEAGVDGRVKEILGDQQIEAGHLGQRFDLSPWSKNRCGLEEFLGRRVETADPSANGPHHGRR